MITVTALDKILRWKSTAWHGIITTAINGLDPLAGRFPKAADSREACRGIDEVIDTNDTDIMALHCTYAKVKNPLSNSLYTFFGYLIFKTVSTRTGMQASFKRGIRGISLTLALVVMSSCQFSKLSLWCSFKLIAVAILARSVVFPVLSGVLLAVVATFCCCQSLPAAIWWRTFNSAICFIPADRLDEHYQWITAARLFLIQGYDPMVVRMAELFDNARSNCTAPVAAALPSYNSHNDARLEMAYSGGILIAAVAVFGWPRVATEWNQCIDILSFFGVLDDFHDVEKDRKVGKSNYFLDSYAKEGVSFGCQPLSWWMLEYNRALGKMKDEEMKSWFRGNMRLYNIERAIKSSALVKMEYREAEQSINPIRDAL